MVSLNIILLFQIIYRLKIINMLQLSIDEDRKMKKTIKDYNLEGKRVIIRCDFNVPLNNKNKITDYTRIKANLKTIRYAIIKGAKIILLSHLGKVKCEDDKKNNSLYPVAIALSKYLNKK